MVKLKVFVKDGHRIEEYKGKYDPDDQIIEIKKKTGLFTREPERFKINPDHIYEKLKRRGKKIEYWVIVNRRSRKSEPIGKLNDPPEVDQRLRIDLNDLTNANFIKAVKAKKKLDKWNLIIYMFSGYGVIRFFEWMIFYIMQAR